MLETILKLYSMAMATGVTSPLPHLFGPPGCGKSSVIEQAAEMIGVNLHIINVSRLSPLEVEGVQMPHGDAEDLLLKMLPATFWTQLRKGDILLLDEFLRGFPEVYNALLDILTARRVGAFMLPPVFIIGASNSTVAYDKALEDRLLHLPVADPRTNTTARKEMGDRLVDTLGLLPWMKTSPSLISVLNAEVLPMYEVLDSLNAKVAAPTILRGRSLRNLIGQAQLRQVQSSSLETLLLENNLQAMSQGKPQYVFLLNGKNLPAGYDRDVANEVLAREGQVLPLQLLNTRLNLELMEIEAIRQEKGTTNDDAHFIDDSHLDELLNS